MPTFLIPVLTNNPFFEISVPLDGIVHILEFYWNIRAQRFFLSVFDSENKLIISGIPIVLNFPLFYQYKNLNIPKGHLYAAEPSFLLTFQVYLPIIWISGLGCPSRRKSLGLSGALSFLREVFDT